MTKRKTRARKEMCEPLESRVLLSAAPLIIGYLPDYEFSHFSSIDLGTLSQINYFSITANSSGALSTTSSSGFSLSQLQTVVTAAHAAPSRVSVSITIDPGSAFQAIADSSTATTAFVANVMSFISTYHLDGVDLDYEPGTLTTMQKNDYGNLLAALHAQTSAHGLILSAAVQVSQMIVPKADLSDIDRYFVMDYDLEFDSSAPYDESLTYLAGWANYGVPKADLFMGVPFYGRSGSSWGDSTTETYAQILTAYEAANGGALPSPDADTVTIGLTGPTWGFNGPTTVHNKAVFVLQNGYGGMMIWELGQDQFASGGYGSAALLPAIKAVFAAASETWTGSVSTAWNNPANWNYGAVPGTTTNVVINSGAVTMSSPLNVASLNLNGGTLTLSPGAGVFTTSSLTIAPGAVLDIGNNSLIINYAGTADPIATIRGYLTTGDNNGTWNGAGIDSSAAASNAGYGIGYADGADGVVSGLASGQIEVAYTLYGDANLDGIVSGDDFSILAGNLGKPEAAWDEGDFLYNGVVSGDDFSVLVANMGKSSNGAAITLPIAGIASLDAVVGSSTTLTKTASTPSSVFSNGQTIAAPSPNSQHHVAAKKRHHA
jgi:Glycosyl hydrolases family 18